MKQFGFYHPSIKTQSLSLILHIYRDAQSINNSASEIHVKVAKQNSCVHVLKNRLNFVLQFTNDTNALLLMWVGSELNTLRPHRLCVFMILARTKDPSMTKLLIVSLCTTIILCDFWAWIFCLLHYSILLQFLYGNFREPKMKKNFCINFIQKPEEIEINWMRKTFLCFDDHSNMIRSSGLFTKQCCNEILRETFFPL